MAKTEKRKLIKRFSNVIVSRMDYKFARHFSDLEFYNDGFAYFFMWKTQGIRIPILNTIRDTYVRLKRKRMPIEEAIKHDPALEKEIKKIRKLKPAFVKYTPEQRPRNGFVKYSDIKGIVVDGKHKIIDFNINGEEFLRLIIRHRKTFNKILSYYKKFIPEEKFKVKEQYMEKSEELPIPPYWR